MNKLEIYNNVFLETFQLADTSPLNADFNADNVESWDSVCQLTLVTNIEDALDIMLEPEDIVGFKSYETGKEILCKYGVVISAE